MTLIRIQSVLTLPPVLLPWVYYKSSHWASNWDTPGVLEGDSGRSLANVEFIYFFKSLGPKFSHFMIYIHLKDNILTVWAPSKWDRFNGVLWSSLCLHGVSPWKEIVSYSPSLVQAKLVFFFYIYICLVTKQTVSSRMCLNSEDERNEIVPALSPPPKKNPQTSSHRSHGN